MNVQHEKAPVMRVVATALLLTGTLLATAASSEEHAMTAADLHELCAGSDHVSRNACRIYILGVTQGIAVGLNMAAGRSRAGRPCIPDGVSAEALEQTLKARLDKDLSASPAHRSQDAAEFVGAALIRAFPCSAPRSR